MHSPRDTKIDCKLNVLNFANVLGINKCSSPEGNCTTCDYCVLQRKIVDTKIWFTQIGRKYKIKFIHKLLVISNSNYDLLHLIEQLLEIVNRSDSVNVFSSVDCLHNDKPNHLPSHLSSSSLDNMMMSNCSWFKSANYWSQVIYFLSLMEGGDLVFLRLVYNEIQQLKTYKLHLVSLGLHPSFNICQHWPSDIPRTDINLSLELMNKIAASIAKNNIQIQNYYPNGYHPKQPKNLFQKKLCKSKARIPHLLRRDNVSKFTSESSDKYFLPSGTILEKSIIDKLIKEAKEEDVLTQNELQVIKKGPYILKKQYIDVGKETLMNVDLINSFRPNFDFLILLPRMLQLKIFDLLDNDSLTVCLAVSSSWKRLVLEVIESHSAVFSATGKSKKDVAAPKKVADKKKEEKPLLEKTVPFLKPQEREKLYEFVVDLNPNFATDIFIDIPKFESDVEKYKTINYAKKDNKQVYANYEADVVHRVLVEVRNVFCTPYKSIILLEKRDFTRLVHHDGKDLIAIQYEKTPVKFYSIRNLKSVSLKLKPHPDSLRCMQLIQSDHMFFGAGYDTTVRGWSTKTGLCCKIFPGFTSTVLCLSIYNEYLTAGSKDGKMKLWDIELNKLLYTFSGNHPITAVCVTDIICISGSNNGNVCVYSINSGHKIKNLNIHTGVITCIKANHWVIATSSKDKFARVWSALGNFDKCLSSLQHSKEVTCVELLYMCVLTSCWDGIIKIWNLQSGNILKEICPNCQNKLSPILSFYIGTKWIIINTIDNIQILNFDPSKWEYIDSIEGYGPFDYRNTKTWKEQLIILQRNARIVHQDKNIPCDRNFLKEKSNTILFRDVKYIISQHKLLRFLMEHSINEENLVPLCRRVSLSAISDLHSDNVKISLEEAKYVLYQQYHSDRLCKSLEPFFIYEDNNQLKVKSISRKTKSGTDLHNIESKKGSVRYKHSLADIIRTKLEQNKEDSSWNIKQVKINQQMVRPIRKYKKY